jgi:hypothetical protein
MPDALLEIVTFSLYKPWTFCSSETSLLISSKKIHLLPFTLNTNPFTHVLQTPVSFCSFTLKSRLWYFSFLISTFISVLLYFVNLSLSCGLHSYDYMYRRHIGDHVKWLLWPRTSELDVKSYIPHCVTLGKLLNLFELPCPNW